MIDKSRDLPMIGFFKKKIIFFYICPQYIIAICYETNETLPIKLKEKTTFTFSQANLDNRILWF